MTGLRGAAETTATAGTAFVSGLLTGAQFGCLPIVIGGAVLGGLCATFFPGAKVVCGIILLVGSLAVCGGGVYLFSTLFGDFGSPRDKDERVVGVVGSLGFLLFVVPVALAVNSFFWSEDFRAQHDESVRNEKARQEQEQTERKARQEQEQLESEFTRLYKFEPPQVEVRWSRSLFGGGEITLANKTECEWKSVYLILNPSMEGVLDELRFHLIEQDGFRGPANKDKTYVSVKPGDKLDVSLDEFVHTKTGEKFSLARYDFRKLYVKAVVLYKGHEFPCDCVLVPTSAK